jgi:hypothetical protein
MLFSLTEREKNNIIVFVVKSTRKTSKYGFFPAGQAVRKNTERLPVFSLSGIGFFFVFQCFFP